MKKLISIMLSMCMLFSCFAYALPVMDTVESAEEVSVTEEAPAEEAEVETYAAEIDSNVVYEWDFENGVQSWADKGKHPVSWENGKLVVTHTASGGYFKHTTATDLVKADIKYVVINARATGGVKGIKYYFNTSASATGMSEAATFSIQMNDSEDFKNYVFDLSKNAQWTGANYANCMFQLLGYGTTTKLEIESIKFLSDVDDYLLENHYDIPNTNFTIMGGHTFTKNTDGSVTFTSDATEKNTCVYIPAPAVEVYGTNYKHFVLKTKKNSENIGTVKKFGVTAYFYEKNDKAWGNCKPSAVMTDGTYDYMVFKLGVNDNITNHMIQLNGVGSIDVVDIFYTSEAGKSITGADYVWDFEEGNSTGLTAWNSNMSFTVADGVMTVTRTTGTSGGAAIDVVPQVTLGSDDYPYAIIKVKGAQTRTLTLFYNMTGQRISASRCIEVSPYTTDSNYTYYVWDFSNVSAWTGNIGDFDFACGVEGSATYTYDVEEIRLSDNLDTVPAKINNYIWDFEDGTYNGIGKFASNDNNTISVEDGCLEMTTAASVVSGGNGFQFKRPSLQSSDYPYLVLKVKNEGTTSTPTKVYIGKNGTESITEDLTLETYTSSAVTGDHTYYVYDLTYDKVPTDSNTYSGPIAKIVLQASGGTLLADEIRLTNNLDFLPLLEYKWDFEEGTVNDSGIYKGIGAFSANNTIAVADGMLEVTYAANGASGSGINIYPQETIAADNYPYFVVKVKQEDTAPELVQVYIQAGTMTNIAADAKVTPEKISDSVAGYDYYVFNLSSLAKWAGTVTKVVLQSELGTYHVEEMYFTNNVSDIKATEVEKVELTVEKLALYTSGSITTDRGQMTLTPYVRMSDGSELTDFSDVYYITDSVNAQVVKNADGTATVTGQINGDVNVTAVMPDYDVSITKKITVSGQEDRLAATDLTVLMFGNSIRQHGYHATNWPWSDMRGMASSSIDKDYAHRFIHYIEQKYGEGTATLVNSTSVSGFERSIPGTAEDKDFSSEIAPYLADVKNAKPDIISIQMGENVSGATQAQYENAVGQLYEAFRAEVPDAIIIVCTPFWAGDYKINGMTNVSKKYDIPLAQVHTLNKEENYARKTAEGWFLPATASGGVEVHPGDTGMDRIAQLIFEQANIKLSQNEPTVYSPAPESITITPETAEITEQNGTLQLSAAVLPADAVSDVVWSISNENIATIDENGLVTAINNTGAETLTVTATSKFVDTVKAEINVTITGQTPAYTVTYDGNADGVTNVPEANVYAKEGFTFANTYPERSTYKFLGWATTPDGEVVDTLDVTENITVYAQWEKAHRWYFDKPGYKEGFIAEDAFNEYVLDGAYEAMATETNVDTGEVLKFMSPVLDLPAEDYYTLKMRIQNTNYAANTTLDLTVKTTDGDANYSAAVTGTDFTVYEFNIDDLTGTITGFEFTPTNIDCAVRIDSIEFIEHPVLHYNANTTDTVTNMPAGTTPTDSGLVELSTTVPVRTGYTFLGWAYTADSRLLIDTAVAATKEANVTVYAVWDKNDHWEMDSKAELGVSRWVKMENQTFENGIFSFTSTGDNVFEINTSDFGYPVSSTSGILNARMKWNNNSSATHSQIFFKTTTQTGFAEASSSKITLPSTVSEDYQIVNYDFTSATNWSGNLSQFRFDLLPATGTVAVDYIRFTNSDANLVTADGETRNLSYDDAVTHIVRKGGVIAPAGGVEIKGLALTGDIDMTNGYITVTGNVEIEENAPYAVFTLDTEALGLTNGENLYISGYNSPVTVTDGAKYIIKLTDGAGYVFAGTDTSKRVVYAVTKAGQGDVSETGTLDAASIRTSTPQGIRYAGFVSAAYRTLGAIEEYGYIVAAAEYFENGDYSALKFNANGDVSGTLDDIEANYASAAAYKNDGTDYSQKLTLEVAKQHFSESVLSGITGEGYYYSAVLTNIPETHYADDIVGRTYVKINGKYYYGAPVIRNIYNMALEYKAKYESEQKEVPSYITAIIDIVAGQNN